MDEGLNLTDGERRILARVDKALAAGIELKAWFERADASGTLPNTYKESFVFTRPLDRSFGFIGEAQLPSGTLPINGNVQRQFYDEPKAPSAYEEGAAVWMRNQVQEFVLHYFLRIADYREPQEFPNPGQAPPPPGLALFSQCPTLGDPEREGFGFSQEFFKLRATGEIGRFPQAVRSAIVDQREIGTKYEWILLKNPVFNFDFEFKPLGNSGPQLVLPLAVSNYLVVSREFVTDEEDPEPGVAGRYGIGYAFIADPGTDSFLAYGPGELEPAFQTITWDVRDNGETVVEAVFTANQPTGLFNVSLNPLALGLSVAELFDPAGTLPGFLRPFKRAVDRLPLADVRIDPVFPSVALLNVLTAGQAAARLCISREQIIKTLLFVHFQQHYQTILGSLQTWRQIPDWLDRGALPKFVITGKSA